MQYQCGIRVTSSRIAFLLTGRNCRYILSVRQVEKDRQSESTRPSADNVNDDTNINTDKETDMDTIEVKRDNDADLRFEGEEIATVPSFEGKPEKGANRKLTLYRTKAGKLVCAETDRSSSAFNHPRYAAFIASDDTDMVAQLGYGFLAKDLYASAGIDCAETID